MKFRIVAFVYLLIGIIALESVTFAQPQSGKKNDWQSVLALRTA